MAGKPEHSVGAAAIEKYFASYAGFILSGGFELREQEILIIDARSFLAQGFASFRFGLAGGRETILQVRTTLLIAQENGWKIRSYHFSPIPEAPPLKG